MCKYIYVFYISGLIKNSLAIVTLFPVTAEGKPKGRVGGLGTSPGAALLSSRWIPVWDGMCWPRLFSTVLCAGLSPLASSPQAPSMCPQSRIHPCGLCSTPASERRGDQVVPRVLASLCGACQWRRKEGQMEQSMNLLRIGPNTNPKILYFMYIIKKIWWEGTSTGHLVSAPRENQIYL